MLTIPANTALRLARATLELPAAAGQAFDVMCRRVSGSGGNLSMKLQGGGNNATGGSAQNGWLSAPVTATANRATFDIQVTGNFAAVIDNVSVRLQALAARKFHVISFAGQSNMVGASAGPCDPRSTARIRGSRMMPGAPRRVPAGRRHHHPSACPGPAPLVQRGIGPDLSFARTMPSTTCRRTAIS